MRRASGPPSRLREGSKPLTKGIKDKVVVITGASSGLGEARRGCSPRRRQLVLGARRLDRLQALASELSLAAARRSP